MNAQWGKFIKGDLLRREDVDGVFEQDCFSAVMYFSAKSLVGESMRDPNLYYRNNVIGTLNPLDAMAKYGVKSFVFSSSAAVYGAPSYSPIDEVHPTAAINPHGRTKLMVEMLLRDFEDAYDTFHCVTSMPPVQIGTEKSEKNMNRKPI